MNKEFYTAKEIIMGTRSEYQKIQNKKTLRGFIWKLKAKLGTYIY